MEPSRQILRQLERCGGETYLVRSDGTRMGPFRALIQPLRYKNKMYLEGTQTPVGLNARGYYMYIGPADRELQASPDEWIESGGTRYEVSRAETVTFRGAPAYRWAILRNMTEAEV